MLTAVITDPNRYNINRIKAINKKADIVEFRLDYFNNIDYDFLHNFKSKFKIPIIFTLRKKSQGGQFIGAESHRLNVIKELLQLLPDYFDLEYDTDKKFINKVLIKYPNIKIISSYHDFVKTPTNLNGILDAMLYNGISAYKIAAYANSMLDSIRMLCFLAKINLINKIKLIGICMSDFGRITRLLSSLCGSFITYTHFPYEHSTAPGQISINEISTFLSFMKKLANTVINFHVRKSVKQGFTYNFDQNVINVRLMVLANEHDEICQVLHQIMNNIQLASGKLYY